jgi:hypothetical protein
VREDDRVMGVDDEPVAPGGSNDRGLIGPNDVAFHLDLTAAQLKVTYGALHSFFDDLGHEEHDVRQVVASVLAKLPGAESIRAIDLDTELRRAREQR